MATSNPMVPTPTTPGMGYEESLYRGIALAQLRILKQQMQLGGLFIGNRRVRLDNGVEILCNIAGRHESVRVVLPDTVPAVSTKVADAVTHGFAMHPRTDQYPDGADFSSPLDGGGYQPLDYDTATSVMFPAYDDDHGTMLLYQNNTAWRAKIQIPENYGILSWVSKDKTVTWRGWPAITLAPGRTTSVEGVTSLDAQTSYNTYYTPLAPYLYVNGRKFPTPGKVRGAAMPITGTVLVSTVNYTQYDVAGFSDNTVNPDGQNWLYDNPGAVIDESNKAGKVGNYYDELYLKSVVGVPYIVNDRVRYVPSDGWLRIGHTISTVSNLGVWFSADAKTAECDEGTWSWSYSAISQVDGQFPEIALPNGTRARPQGVFSSTFTARPIDDNKYQVTPGRTLSSTLEDSDQQQSTASMWSKSSDLSWNLAYMRDAHAVCYMKYSMGGSRYIAVDNLYQDTIPLKYRTRPDPVNYYVDVFFSGVVGQPILFTPINFKSGPYTWDGEVEVAGDTASATISYATYASSCGTKRITVIDACGFSSSVEVRMKTGYWCAITQSGFQCEKGVGCNGTDIPCNGCCGMVSGYWAGTRPDSNDITATSYNEYKYLEGVWCFLRPGDIVCTLTRKWVCSTSVCGPLPPVTC